jgi:uncharacterized protein (DUF697 family)
MLADQMRRDPSRPGVETQSPLPVFDLNSAHLAGSADLIILLLASGQENYDRQKELSRVWSSAGKNLLVILNQPKGVARHAAEPWPDWGQKRLLYGPVEELDFLVSEFIPVVVDILSDQMLALGRQYPLFRLEIAHRLINETSLSNAAYSISTGLAEVVPVFDIPLNVADMVVLTKAQAFLVYKLGLELGFSTQWQDYVAEFGSVLGGGFLWRQLARSLIGLIPAWGIVPKVAVAYAGTYVVGNVVLQWYLTGRHVTRQQMSDLYRQAFSRGKEVARNLLAKFPQPRLKKREPKALPAPKRRRRPVCPECGRTNAKDALFCQYCGHPLTSEETTT